MNAVEKILAALDEAERVLDRALIGIPPFEILPEHTPTEVLYITTANRERAQIQHAREVLARHKVGRGGNGWMFCQACSDTEAGAWSVAWPCDEVESLLAVWCPDVTP